MPAPQLILAKFDGEMPPLPDGAPWPSPGYHTNGHSCAECPECQPAHLELLARNDDESAIKDPASWAAYEQALTTPVHAFFDLAQTQMQLAKDWWLRCGMALNAARDALAQLWADFGEFMDGHADGHRVSLTPRSGWIEINPAPGLRVWIASPEDEAIVQSMLVASMIQQRAADLVAEIARWEPEVAQAEAASQATDAHYETEMAAARAWLEAGVARYNTHAQRILQARHQAHIAWQHCLWVCERLKIPPLERLVLILAGFLLISGVRIVVNAEPFDKGDDEAAAAEEVVEPESNADTVAEVGEDEAPEQEAAEAIEPEFIPAPDLTRDETLTAAYMQEAVGIQMGPALLPFLREPSVLDKLGPAPVSPIPRSSFTLSPLAELGLADNLGPTPTITDHGVTRLQFEEPMDDAISNLVATYGATAGLSVPPSAGASGPSSDLFGVNFVVDGDLLDPQRCASTDLSLTLSISDPNTPERFQADPAFPGDYYDGGNRFINFGVNGCSGTSTMDEFGPDGLTRGLGVPAGAIMNVVDGMTHAVVLVDSAFLPDGAEVTTILFEYQAGVPFTLENTRYQSVPDITEPGQPVATATTTQDCDFGLDPVPVPPTEPAPSTQPAPSTPPTDDEPPSGGGGGSPSSGGSEAPDDTPSADQPTTTGGPITQPSEPDVDETRPALATAGAMLASVGAAAGTVVATRRRERSISDREDEMGEPATLPQRDIDPSTHPPASVVAGTADIDAEASAAAISAARDAVTEAETAYRAAVAKAAARQSAADDESWFDNLHDWWTGAETTEDALFQRAQTEVGIRRDALRKATAELIAIQLYSVPPEARHDLVTRLIEENTVQAASVTTEVSEEVERVILDEPSRDRAQTLAVANADLDVPGITREALLIARSRLPITAESHYTSAVLDDLASTIRDTEADRERRPGSGTDAEWWQETEAHYRTREWLRDAKRDLQVETFVAVAEQATVVDRRNGRPIPTDQRRKLAADRINWAAEYLDNVSWRRDDSRTTTADDLRNRLSASYRSLDYLGYGPTSMNVFFLSTAQAIRDRQADINDWFLSDYLGLEDRLGSEAQQDDGSWIRLAWAAFNTGLGTTARVSGLADDDLDEVTSRIEEMNADADLAVLALTVAAETTDPNDWPPGRRTLPGGGEVDTDLLREMLLAYGYLSRGSDGDLRYTMPGSDPVVTRSTRIDLPGRHWLDVISARNASEIVLTVALPELAALRVAAAASRLGVAGARAATALRLITDQSLGLALDVSLTYLNSARDADLRVIIADSAINNVAGLLSRAGTDRLARIGVGRVQTGTELGAALSDPDTHRLATTVVGEMLGIPGDAATQLIIQSAKGHGVTNDDVLAALLGAAVNRGVTKATLAHPAWKRLESQISPESVALDRQLNTDAIERFDRVVGDAPLSTATGTVVFEALRNGHLTWEQLQRVYSSRGNDVLPIMNRVNQLRTELVNSVGTRARVLARSEIARDYGELIDASPAGQRDALTAERDRELSLIADPMTEVTVAARFTSEALDLDGLSRTELLVRVDGKEAIAKAQTLSLPALRELVVSQLAERYTSAVRKAAGDEIAPGSAGPTSDVDRSWSSEYLRRAAQSVILQEMVRHRLDGTLGPTMARAFDVNEYNNVMQRIPTLIAARESYADLIVDTIVVERRSDGSERSYELSHRDAVEANSFASAMLHMDAERRARFEENTIGSQVGADADRIRAMFTFAKRSLADSKVDLDAALDSQDPSINLTSGDRELRARDALYGDRMRSLEKVGQAIDAEPGDTRERRELMSRWELLMNRALRDGIETYSDMANLEIVVIRMQSQRKPNGDKLKPVDLMRSEAFKLGGEALEGITAQQIRSMLNDQILMLMHHVDAVQSGHESPAKATRSFAKYTERALLALSILGEFDPSIDGRYTELFEATRALMAHKDNPEQLLITLQNLRPDLAGDTAANLRWYLDQIERLPGLAGLTSDRTSTWVAPRFSETLSGREWERELRALGDSHETSAALMEQLLSVEVELASISREITESEALADVQTDDLPAARRLREQIAELELRLDFLTSPHFVGERFKTLRRDLVERRTELAALREPGGPDDRAGERIRLRRLRDVLELRKEQLESELTR